MNKGICFIIICGIILTLLLFYKKQKIIYRVSEFPHMRELDKSFKSHHYYLTNYVNFLLKNKEQNNEMIREPGHWLPEQTKNDNRYALEDKWHMAWTNNGKWYNYPIIYNHKTLPHVDEKLKKILEPYEKYINVMGFSWLKSFGIIKPHIDEHTGMEYGKLVYHYNIISNGSIITINEIDYKQIQQQSLIFDSMFKHSVINLQGDRVIIYIDFNIK